MGRQKRVRKKGAKDSYSSSRKSAPKAIRAAVIPNRCPAIPLGSVPDKVDESLEFIVDSLDLEILRLMQGNARLSNVEIAGSLETSEATIRRRIQSMVDSGIIRGFVTQIDHGRFSPKVRVHLAIDASLGDIDAVAKKLLDRPELCSLYRSIGQYNLLCEMLMDDMSSTQSFIDEITKTDGVNGVSSLITTAPLKPCPWYGL